MMPNTIEQKEALCSPENSQANTKKGFLLTSSDGAPNTTKLQSKGVSEAGKSIPPGSVREKIAIVAPFISPERLQGKCLIIKHPASEVSPKEAFTTDEASPKPRPLPRKSKNASCLDPKNDTQKWLLAHIQPLIKAHNSIQAGQSILLKPIQAFLIKDQDSTQAGQSSLRGPIQPVVINAQDSIQSGLQAQAHLQKLVTELREIVDETPDMCEKDTERLLEERLIKTLSESEQDFSQSSNLFSLYSVVANSYARVLCRVIINQEQGFLKWRETLNSGSLGKKGLTFGLIVNLQEALRACEQYISEPRYLDVLNEKLKEVLNEHKKEKRFIFSNPAAKLARKLDKELECILRYVSEVPHPKVEESSLTRKLLITGRST